MGAEYQLRIVDTAGATQAIITDYLQLAYTRVVNAAGMVSFDLSADHPAISYIVHNNQVEVWRRNETIGLAWRREIVGIIRSLTWTTSDSTVVRVTAPGAMAMLGWNIVAFRAGTANRSLFTNLSARRVMSRIVQYNCTATGATSARLRPATSSGKISGLYTVTFEAEVTGGNTIDYGCAYANVLLSLQDVQKIAGGDFDLVKTAGATFEYRWYTGQLGTDKTATVRFSLELGNMSEPVFTDERLSERTVAIVGGQGEEADRMIVVETGGGYVVSSRAFEMFVNASSDETRRALVARGDQAIDDARAKPQFSFVALQAPNAYYGVHYDLGDLVTGVYRGVSYTEKVDSVAVQFDSQAGEQIDVQMKQV